MPKRNIKTETGYNRETVEKLIERFIGYGKIDYNDASKKIMLLNWARHNWNNSPKVVARVEKELRSVKHVPFALSYLEIANAIKSDTVSIQYPYRMDSLGKQEIRDKEKDKEKDKDKEQQQEPSPSNENFEDPFPKSKPTVAADAPGMVFRFYETNMGSIVQSIAEHLDIFIDDSSEELIHGALRRAVVANATNKMRFAEKILRSWHDQRLKTMSDVEATDKALERRKQQSKSYGKKPVREERLPEWFNKPNEERVPETVPSQCRSALEEEKRKLLERLKTKRTSEG